VSYIQEYLRPQVYHYVILYYYVRFAASCDFYFSYTVLPPPTNVLAALWHNYAWGKVACQMSARGSGSVGYTTMTSSRSDWLYTHLYYIIMYILMQTRGTRHTQTAPRATVLLKLDWYFFFLFYFIFNSLFPFSNTRTHTRRR